MGEEVTALLRWILAHDPPRQIVLCCRETPTAYYGPGTTLVVWDTCLYEASIGLPAQLCALGVGHVGVAECPQHDERCREQLLAWQSLTPTCVSSASPVTRGIRRKHVSLILGEITLPRRMILGLGLSDRSPIPIRADDATRTLAAIDVLRARGLIHSGQAMAAPLGAVDLRAQGCNACGVCVQACPHEALELRHDATGSRLVHHANRCRGERQCLVLCPLHALNADHALPLSDMLQREKRVLAHLETVSCQRCGARHPAYEGDLCQICQFRSAHPFGSMWPPA
ncbi:4Fe-4S dicluster domain-containing protein [Trueperella sp. LYQ143]|uniref:4Fe-4S dicluster domain-containing protein n=1 Tax=unclassified Trueperella TaxID=2630174 RepID=UPI00398308E7